MIRPFLAISLLAAPLVAQVQPVSGPGDPRVQWISYDADQVTELRVAGGYVLLVELAPGEKIDTIAIGSSAEWQVTAGKRGDFFVVKNTGSGNRTNLSIVSDSRTYNFELVGASSFGASPYNVRFRYGTPAAVIEANEADTQFEYRISGAERIRPSSISIFANRTILEWPAESPLPAIFMVQDGAESLVNGEMQDGQFVIAGTPDKLVFRLDKAMATAVRSRVKERNH